MLQDTSRIPDVSRLAASFAGARLLVIGDAMLDRYLHGHIDRLSREAPVPIVDLDACDEAPGGAANTAANAAALGADVRLLAAAGADPSGRRLLDLLAGNGVDPALVLPVEGRGTLTKTRVIAGPQMLARLDEGSTDALPLEAQGEVEAHLCEALEWADAVLVSDYGYGVVSPLLLSRLAQLRSKKPLPLVVDGKDLRLYQGLHPTAIKPNYDEVVRLLGAPPGIAWSKRRDLITLFGDQILGLTDAQIAAVTLDEDGALVFERGRPPFQTYARRRADASVAGAGDTFVAAFTLALVAGADSATAGEVASCAANAAVAMKGTAVCSLQRLQDSLLQRGHVIDGLDRLRQEVEDLRAKGRRIVFTNGCFDIIHPGHVSYLSSAKALGDVLIVGVNSDASVRRLKGPNRPINTLDDRLAIMSALSSVDYIVPFEEDTPEDLIRAIRPDVFAKGGDYTVENLPEAPLVRSLGGDVRILPYVEERSTTEMIRRIVQMSGAA